MSKLHIYLVVIFSGVPLFAVTSDYQPRLGYDGVGWGIAAALQKYCGLSFGLISQQAIKAQSASEVDVDKTERSLHNRRSRRQEPRNLEEILHDKHIYTIDSSCLQAQREAKKRAQLSDGDSSK